MDRITFDFETGEIIFDCDGQKGIEIDPTLKEKRKAIMDSAGFESIEARAFCKEVNQMFAELGFTNLKCGNFEED